MYSVQEQEEIEYQNGTPYGTGAYWDQEAQMGARWMVQDGKPCPCHGTGWLTTSMDTAVRCPNCPARPGYHPYDDEKSDDQIDAEELYESDPSWRSLVDTLERLAW